MIKYFKELLATLKSIDASLKKISSCVAIGKRAQHDVPVLMTHNPRRDVVETGTYEVWKAEFSLPKKPGQVSRVAL